MTGFCAQQRLGRGKGKISTDGIADGRACGALTLPPRCLADLSPSGRGDRKGCDTLPSPLGEKVPAGG